MKIYTTWTDEFRAFRQFFKGHDVELLPKDYKGLKCDLLIFPGGSDVNPVRYGHRIPENSIYEGWVNPDRDEWEFSVFTAIRADEFRPTKVLGICRGMQFLNVAMSGSLVYDIPSRFGKAHPTHHPITWLLETVFSPVKVVNSMHHQALHRLNDRIPYTILAIEPESRVIEAILWKDKYLGMQYHPELWGNDEEMEVFSKGILDWVLGKSLLVGRRSEEATNFYIMSDSFPDIDIDEEEDEDSDPDNEETEEDYP